jgi:hypothetical protein
MNCNRCNKSITDEDREFCWYCHGDLCYDCWDAWGHCGHPEAEAENRRAYRVKKPKINLVDACFHQSASSIAGDNSDLPPERFDWYRGPDQVSKHKFFTSWTLKEAVKDPHPNKIAWLLEPPAIQTWPYDFIYEHHDKFEAVLTYSRQLLDQAPKIDNLHFCPHGGSWISSDDWSIKPKYRNVCMIASEKMVTPGHMMRHMVANKYGHRIDLLGYAYRPFERIVNALKQYRYAVVIESVLFDWYFSEKLIDCLATGTVPIYRGCPSFDDFFDLDGIIRFDDEEELGDVLDSIGPQDYAWRMDAIRQNFARARSYFRAEDWAQSKYPELFT